MRKIARAIWWSNCEGEFRSGGSIGLKLSRFCYILILFFYASLFNSGTDLNFAWSVPADYGLNTTEGRMVHFDVKVFPVAYAHNFSQRGMMHYKKVERLTYTFIAFPSVFLGFAGMQILATALINKCWRGEVHGIWCNAWACDLPHLAKVYNCTLQGMAYLSATLNVGVNCHGAFCHGKGSSRLVSKAKDTETI